MSRLKSKTYLVIYSWLMGLTALEVALAMMGLPKMALAILLVSTALAKASLIVLYFMHMKFDKPLVWLLPGIPVALALFFVGMLFPDMVYHAVQRFL